jgi:hypothetical protein
LYGLRRAIWMVIAEINSVRNEASHEWVIATGIRAHADTTALNKPRQQFLHVDAELQDKSPGRACCQGFGQRGPVHYPEHGVTQDAEEEAITVGNDRVR